MIRAAYINFHMSLTLHTQQGLEGMLRSLISLFSLLAVATRVAFAV